MSPIELTLPSPKRGIRRIIAIGFLAVAIGLTIGFALASLWPDTLARLGDRFGDML